MADNKQYIEYGKVFTHHDATDFQILDRSGDEILAIAGRERCEQFIDWGLNFPQPPSKSPFIQKVPNHSVALLPFRGSYLFVQIQRREEGEFARSMDSIPRINRPFNQLRFTLLDESQISSYLSISKLFYSRLLYENRKNNNLGKHPNALKDYTSPGGVSSELLPNVESIERWDEKDDPFVIALINAFAGSLNKKRSNLDVVVLCSDLEWHQKLNIVQKAQILLWPLFGILTFALDYITENNVNLRFYNNPLPKALGGIIPPSLDSILGVKTELYEDLLYISAYFSNDFSDEEFIQKLRKYFLVGCAVKNASLIAAILTGKDLPPGASIFSVISDKNTLQAIKENNDYGLIESRIKNDLPATDMLYALIDQAPIKLSSEAKRALLLPFSNKINNVGLRDVDSFFEFIHKFSETISGNTDLLESLSVHINDELFRLVMQESSFYSPKHHNIALRMFVLRTNCLFDQHLIGEDWFELYSCLQVDLHNKDMLRLLGSSFVNYVENHERINFGVITQKIMNDLFLRVDLIGNNEVTDFSLRYLLKVFPFDFEVFNKSLMGFVTRSDANWLEVTEYFCQEKKIGGLIWLLNSGRYDSGLFSELLFRFLEVPLTDDEISIQIDHVEALVMMLKTEILALQDLDRKRCFDLINRLTSISITKSNFPEQWFFDVVVNLEEMDYIIYFYENLYNEYRKLSRSKSIFEKNPRLERFLKINFDRDLPRLGSLCDENVRVLYVIIKSQWNDITNIDKVLQYFIGKISTNSFSNQLLAMIVMDGELLSDNLNNSAIQVQTFRLWLVNTRTSLLRRFYEKPGTGEDMLRGYAISANFLSDDFGWEVFVEDYLTLFPESFIWDEYVEKITNWKQSDPNSKFSTFSNHIKSLGDSNMPVEVDYKVRLEAVKAMVEYQDRKTSLYYERAKHYIPKLSRDSATLNKIKDVITLERPSANISIMKKNIKKIDPLQEQGPVMISQDDSLNLIEQPTKQQYPRKKIKPLDVDANAVSWARKRLAEDNYLPLNRVEKTQTILPVIGALILVVLILILICLGTLLFSSTFSSFIFSRFH